MQAEEADEQLEQNQLKVEADALVAKENELLGRLGGKLVMQNLSLLTEEAHDKDNEETKRKYQYMMKHCQPPKQSREKQRPC